MKKKIFAITLTVCLIVLSIAGTSLAYFTDIEEASNVFTSGNVNITLTYAGETADADTNATPLAIESRAYPGQTYELNASIANVGSEKAYVGAIITLTNDSNVLSGILANTDAAKGLFAGLDAAAQCVAVTNGYKIYVVVSDALDAKDGSTVDTATILTSLTIPSTWDNEEMGVFGDSEITVEAYATQTVGDGFDTAAKALKTAFATEWADYVIS